MPISLINVDAKIFNKILAISIFAINWYYRFWKSFWQNSAGIYDKNPPASAYRQTIPQNNKGFIQQTYDIIPNDEKLKAFPLRLGTRQRNPLFPLLFKIVLEVLATAIREEKEVKWIQIGKEVKLSMFADYMILYIENSKDTTGKLLELINEFDKVTRLQN